MQTEMLFPALVGFIIGVILTYLLLRLTRGSIKAEQELKHVKAELNEKQKQLEKHFAESANLLKTLSEDYKNLYHHLANASNQLLPESKELFTINTLEDKTRIEPTISDSESKTFINDKEDQPRDYSSEGASGILRAER
ncbi:YhcB family protein [Pasteurella bettyae]|uniref:Z-ring associated protein G n=1 Tax=Pasteurella bettyae CCUG 2042 TaxID=1095749 RepID=I3DIG4_9PAST|nr:YhcB family protein [Pasteurella bettyae]EIJ71507.1 hypothetical protein HMPREF1052_0237 [Pasteurella bettyae CCUG 2042]SUB21768.1 putative transmembrane protein [Pasteurella bettyae]